MASRVLLGPDGHPIVSTSRPEVLTPDAVLHATEEAIGKKVRSQATTLSSVWDKQRGKPKPTPISYDTLRMMSQRNEWLRAIIKTRKNQIGKAKWSIVPKDPDDKSASTMRLCESQTQLLKRPSMHGSRPHSRGWRQFIAEVLEDILVLDAGAIEKERNGRGWIVAMYPVDGATIRPNIDEYGGFHDDAYVQIIDGQITARFGMEDLVYIMDNPLTDVRFAGYGFSPVENLITSVTAELYASKFNSSYFEKGSVPEGLLNLGEDIDPEDLDAFRIYWQNEIMGKPHAIPIVGGKGVSWESWRAPNRDMQFMEYQQWLLQKMCAVLQISKQEVGELDDVNRSTADSQDDSNEASSIQPILTLLHDYIEVEIIGPHGQGLGDLIQFQWDEEGESQEQIIAKYTAMIPVGAATRAEFRSEMNMDPGDDEGLELYLTDGTPSPLPTKADVAVMGAAAQQQHDDEQAKQQADQQAQAGQTDSSMPWSHADPADPAVKQAQMDHADTQTAAAPADDEGKPEVGKSAADDEHTVELADLHVDHDYQRPIDRGKVTRMRDDKTYRRLPVTVNVRADGSMWLTDGQHRAQAAHEDGETHVRARVTRLDRVSEARSVGIMATNKVFDDRNPAMTARQDGLIDVFYSKHQKLVTGLAGILNVDPAVLDQVDGLT